MNPKVLASLLFLMLLGCLAGSAEAQLRRPRAMPGSRAVPPPRGSSVPPPRGGRPVPPPRGSQLPPPRNPGNTLPPPRQEGGSTGTETGDATGEETTGGETGTGETGAGATGDQPATPTRAERRFMGGGALRRGPAYTIRLKRRKLKNGWNQVWTSELGEKFYVRIRRGRIVGQGVKAASGRTLRIKLIRQGKRLGSPRWVHLTVLLDGVISRSVAYRRVG